MDGTMARKRHKPEEIVSKLRQVDVLSGQGEWIADAVKTIAVTETTYFRRRAEYGGMKNDSGQKAQGVGAGEHPAAAGLRCVGPASVHPAQARPRAR